MTGLPTIDGTRFGQITIDGKTYDADVWLFADGTVCPRDRSVSRGSHVIGREELEALCRPQPEVLFVGTGQSGLAELAPDGREFLRQAGIDCRPQRTPQALEHYNACDRAKAGLFHVTC